MSRPRGGSLDPPVGGQYIHTNNKWSESEVSVMKKIHSAYLRSLDVEEIQRLQDSGSKNDNEFFLPKDSSLRSDKGELTKPIWGGRGPFESFDEFISSTHFTYWIHQTQGSAQIDDVMNDWAIQIIKDICEEQNKDLRDKSSQSLLGGSAKREHFSPLTLLMQDIKLWCVMVLRTAKTTDRDTYLEIGRRIKFLTYLISREVWGVASKLNPFSKGLARDAYHALSNCLQKNIATLRDIHDYCFRRYLQHIAYEKIGLLLHLMHEELFNVARFTSAVSTFDEPVSAARERQLRQDEMVDASVTQAHTDWTVVANVALRYFMKDKISRAALTSDLSLVDVEKDAPPAIKTWISTNPFIHRPKPGAAAIPPASTEPVGKTGAPPAVPEPVLGEVLEDPKFPGLPSCYQACADSLQKELAEGSTMFGSAVAKYVRYPLTKEKLLVSIKRTFPMDADRIRALRAIFKTVASLRDTIPGFFALTEFTKVTRDDQRIMVDSVLRGELIRALAEVCVRFSFVLASVRFLHDELAELAGNALAAQGKMDEAAQLLLNGPGTRRESSQKVAVTNRKGSVLAAKKPVQEVEDPIFVRNLDVACQELMPFVNEGARALFKTAHELASELFHFSPLVGRQIETFEERQCVTLCDLLVRIRGDDFSGTCFLVSRLAPKRDYLNLPAKRMQEVFKFATEECAYHLESDSMMYSTTRAILDQELQSALKPSAHDDNDDDALEAIDMNDLTQEKGSDAGGNKRIGSSFLKSNKTTSSTPKTTTEMTVKIDDDEKSEAGGKKPKKRFSLFGKKF